MCIRDSNKPLFEYSLFQFPKAGYQLSQVTRNLHEHGVQGVMTDYEEKFHSLGTPINRCVATKLAMDPEPEFKPIPGPDSSRRVPRAEEDQQSGAEDPLTT